MPFKSLLSAPLGALETLYLVLQLLNARGDGLDSGSAIDLRLETVCVPIPRFAIGH